MKILLYTDSRGEKISSFQNHEHYSDKLSNVYNVRKYLCTEKWTTTIDFFRTLEDEDVSRYDVIILHTSVVENSPRLKCDAYQKIYKDPKKKKYFDEIFGEKEMKKHMLGAKSDFGTQNMYEGQVTWNMFSCDMAIQSLVPRLEELPNLIWISNSPLVGGNGEEWLGSYWRPRPRNMGIVNEYSKEYIKSMKNTKVIDLTNWTDEEIKKYTTDNIHYTKEGSDLVYSKLTEALREY